MQLNLCSYCLFPCRQGQARGFDASVTLNIKSGRCCPPVSELLPASVRDVASSVRDVAPSVRDVASSVWDVASSVRDVASSVRDVASSVWHVSPCVRGFATSVKNVAASVRDVAPGVRDAATRVKAAAGVDDVEAEQQNSHLISSVMDVPRSAKFRPSKGSRL